MKNSKQLVVYGAGGHAGFVADVAKRCGIEMLGFIDDIDRQRQGTQYIGLPIFGPREVLSLPQFSTVNLFIAVGNNVAREQITRHCKALGFRLVTLVDPGAAISQSAVLGEGVIVGPGAVLDYGVTVGDGSIININASLCHGSVVGNFAHVSPGASVAGNVRLGAKTWIGIGASILDGVAIGDSCVVGAGAAVLHDVPAGLTMVGVPARDIRNK